MASDEQSAFNELLTRLARVPKREVEEEERREQRNEARRKTPKPAAKPGHILPSTEPAK
jgi:hypothetical protein